MKQRKINKNSLVYKTFGKPIRELTPEEFKEYYALRNRKYRERKRENHVPTPRTNTIVYENFGSPIKGLSYEEKKKYDAIRAQRYRDRKNNRTWRIK